MGTLLVGAVVAIIIGVAVGKIYKDLRNGISCSCGCDGCAKCPEYVDHDNQ